MKKVKGTQPKKYYKDLDKDTKKKRADYFKNKDTSKNDNRPHSDKGVRLNQVFIQRNLNKCMANTMRLAHLNTQNTLLR